MRLCSLGVLESYSLTVLESYSLTVLESYSPLLYDSTTLRLYDSLRSTERAITIPVTMTLPTTITIDRVGRLVIPKEIRDAAGIEAGMQLQVSCREGRIEIEPRRRPVRIEKRGRLQVAVSVEEGESLTRAAVTEAQRRARRAEE